MNELTENRRVTANLQLSEGDEMTLCCNLVQMLLDIVMPEIQSINSTAFQTKVECQGLFRLIFFGSPLKR